MCVKLTSLSQLQQGELNLDVVEDFAFLPIAFECPLLLR